MSITMGAASADEIQREAEVVAATLGMRPIDGRLEISGIAANPKRVERQALLLASGLLALLVGLGVFALVLVASRLVAPFVPDRRNGVPASNTGRAWLRLAVTVAGPAIAIAGYRLMLVPVRDLHRVRRVDAAVDALRHAGIPVMVRGAHHRAMLHVFGPFVPITLFVPPEHAGEAHRILDAMC